MAGSFRKALQDKLLSVSQASVGVGTDPSYYVKTFDKKLDEYPIEAFPVLVVNVKQASQNGLGEMGTRSRLFQWNVHVYYLDIRQEYDNGENIRDAVMDRFVTSIELNPNLNGLSASGRTVYDTNFTDILFDESGQDGYYTFTSELYLTVDTSKI